MQASKKLGIVSAIVSLATLLGVQPVQAETLIKTAGLLNSGDARLEDGSLFDRYVFEGSSGQRITIILESRDFDPYLILIAPNGERINENDDISRSNLNSRLVVNLPVSGTYTVYANSYDATKSGQYDITIRTDNQSSTLPRNLAARLLSPSAQRSATRFNAPRENPPVIEFYPATVASPAPNQLPNWGQKPC